MKPRKPLKRQRCGKHVIFKTEADAQKALSRTVVDCLASGKGGSSWQMLKVFKCINSHWHIGRKGDQKTQAD